MALAQRIPILDPGWRGAGDEYVDDLGLSDHGE